jgi:hypothetical protein
LFSHFAGLASTDSSSTESVRSVTLAAAIGRLTSNVVVRGETVVPPPAAGVGWGLTIFVSRRTVGKGSTRKVLTGQILAKNTLFQQMGKDGTQRGAINLEYAGLNPAGPFPLNYIVACSFDTSFHSAIISHSAFKPVITDNVVYSTRRNAIYLDGGTVAATVDGNLIAGNYMDPLIYNFPFYV